MKLIICWRFFLLAFILSSFKIPSSYASQTLQVIDSNSYNEVKENFKDSAKKIGSYHLKVMGFNVYYIELISNKSEFSFTNKLGILINYKRDFKKDKLVERSINEIIKIYKITDENLLNSYKAKLSEIFSDIKKDDRKLAFYDPKKGLKLYHNGQLNGVIEDQEFALRFINIWLNENSSYPKMTKNLLGLNE